MASIVKLLCVAIAILSVAESQNITLSGYDLTFIHIRNCQTCSTTTLHGVKWMKAQWCYGGTAFFET